MLSALEAAGLEAPALPSAEGVLQALSLVAFAVAELPEKGVAEQTVATVVKVLVAAGP